MRTKSVILIGAAAAAILVPPSAGASDKPTTVYIDVSYPDHNSW